MTVQPYAALTIVFPQQHVGVWWPPQVAGARLVSAPVAILSLMVTIGHPRAPRVAPIGHGAGHICRRHMCTHER
jgi:hypothetical protein